MKISMRAFYFPLALLLLSQDVFAQSKADKKALKQLKADIGYLASDELEGRRTGSEGEQKAGDYIIKAYETGGVKPYKGKYRYTFHFVNGKTVGAATQIRIAGKALNMETEAFPLPFSANKKVEAGVLPEVLEQGSVWLIPAFQSADEAADVHFNWENYFYTKSKEAQKQGATGVVFYDSYGSKYVAFNKHSEYDNLDIPLAFIGRDAYNEFIATSKTDIPLLLDVSLQKTDRTGNNIAAYIDNNARYTVVLGAHYDHLGYGEDGNSLYAGKEKEIHNGADDNASGTAALLQLAQWVKKGKLRNYNYLFINFSGEELGLLGSKAFIKEEGLDSTHIAYMINMDMIGRLKDSTHSLTIGGFGTSPTWASVINYNGVHLDTSGVGPSDHASFYYAGIPVLFFFTGTHSDYHKPTDDADKINYTGELKVMHDIFDIVATMDGKPKPVFTPTKQTTVGKVRFKVTLGIMPDYAYEEEGVRIDGVSEGKTAEKAGLKAGDIIIQMGDNKIKGMQTYMEALGKFKEGDKTKVTVRRGKKEMTFPVQFK